jgi:hypothetical protein
MMRFSRMLVAGGLCLALGSVGGAARAEFLVGVTASLNAPTTDSGSITVGQSTLTLAALSGRPVDLSFTATPIPFTFGATQVSSGDLGGTDAFDVPYTWTLTFTHYVNGAPTGAPATLLVAGDVSGSLSAGATSLSNVFTAGPLTTPVSLTVDGASFSAKLEPWTSPGRPFSEALDFSVTLSTAPASFQSTPEPATLALLGVGGALLAAPRLRRRLRPRG